MKNQQAILILGMHRSGTSVLSRLCNISGAYLGESVIEPAADNPKGFWENKDIVLLHDELLEQLNRQWDTTMPLPDRWWDSPKIAATKQKLIDFLRDEFGDKPLWLVKDPRVCLLIPIWLDVLEELNVAPHFLIVNRSPEEIVESLQKRNDMHRDACHLLYLHHYLSAEYWSREFPRSVVNYHDILKDWQRVLIDASKAATIDWPIQAWDGVKGIADVVDSGLRHYEQEDFDRSDELSNLVGSVSDALLAMATGREVEGSHIRTLDAVSEKLNIFERTLAPWQSQIELQVTALRESTNELVIERERYQSVQKELRKVDSARIKFLKENKKLEAVRLKYQNEQVIERERYQSVEKELRKVDSARIKFLKENKKLEAVRLKYQNEQVIERERYQSVEKELRKVDSARIEFLEENKKLEAVRLKYQNEQVIERERYQSVEKELRKVDSARIKFLKENKKLEAVRLEYQNEQVIERERYQSVEKELRKVDSARIEFLEENKKLEAVRLEYQNEHVIERERYQSVEKELRKVDSARIEFLEENKKLEAVRLKYQNEQVIERERYQSVEKELRKVDSARIKFLEENKKLEAVRLEYQAENTRLTEAHKRLQDDGKKLEGIRGLQQAEIITLKDGRDSLNEDVTRLEGINESQGITLEKLRSEQFENQQALEDAKGVLRDIRGENKILYQDIALLSAEQNRIRYSLDEILISTSWKLSAPIRMVGGGVKTIRDLFFLIGRILGSASNARKLIYKGKTAISNHGLLAVLYRLPEYARYARRSMSARGPSKVSVPAQGQEQRFNPHPNQLAEIETIDTDVSIVIPTFNAGDEFYWLLRKLRQQEGFGDLQIIVVDSGSTDDTVELARDADCVVIEIPQKDFSHSYSRNLGAESAKGDYLLFIVQDAYPIGDRWLYGMLSYVRDHADDGVTAVSCAEFCRGDSDVMYDCNVDTHYRFLGCLEYDSIGEYRADDHMSLRSEGQLSDISCLIPRKVFEKYRYMGDYAEDLDLGIRLIRNNNKIAMLASVKTIHSHNRPSYYYLKRSFVDVIFLVRQFEDFEIPRNLTFDGLFDSIINIAGALSRFMGQFETDYCGQTLREVLEGARVDLHTRISERKQSGVLDLQDDRFTVHLEQYRTDYTRSDSKLSEADETTARAIADAFLARLDHFVEFSGDIYREQDQVLRKEILQMFGKTFAATVGSYIGFLYLNRESLDPKHAREIEAVCLDLQAGI